VRDKTVPLVVASVLPGSSEEQNLNNMPEEISPEGSPSEKPISEEELKQIKQESDTLYKRYGGHSVVIKIPLLDAIKVYGACCSSIGGLDFLNQACIEVTMAELQAEDAADPEELQQHLRTCPQIWQHELAASINRVLEACSNEERGIIFDAIEATIIEDDEDSENEDNEEKK
jgi:hypothetical protein